MRLTQHAVSAVLPSVGVTYGFRNVARRVSPSGNWLTEPSDTHERYPFARPRIIGDKRNRTIGTASAVATKPLTRIPIFIISARREIVSSIDIVMLLILHVLRIWVGLPWASGTPRGQPSDYVADFLVGHGPARHILAPVRCAKFRPPGYHRDSQILITHQREIGLIF